MEEAFHRPRNDERALWNVVLGIVGYPAVLVATFGYWSVVTGRRS